MKLTCVGTGTAAPEADRACSGYWVEAGGSRLLLDCGPGVVHSLARLGLDWPRVTHLLLTHFHNDHVGDVPFLFFALHYGVAEARRAPLTVIGPVGTKQLFDRLGAAFGRHVSRPRFGVSFRELPGGGDVALPDLRVRAHATPHTPGSLAFRVEQGGAAFGYTGDTGASEALAAFMRGVDVLVAECSLPDDAAMDAHLTPARLARIAAAARPGVLVPTHVFPQLGREGLPEALRRAGWEGKTVVAHDGTTLP
jgi:ribonuclease BN (tRNA processing enzyme)